MTDKATHTPVTDCGPDGGCEECEVCQYLNWREWVSQVSAGVPSQIESNERVERYIREHYPHVVI